MSGRIKSVVYKPLIGSSLENSETYGTSQIIDAGLIETLVNPRAHS